MFVLVSVLMFLCSCVLVCDDFERRVLGAPPHDDPRSREWQARYNSRGVDYPLTVKGHTLLNHSNHSSNPLWMPDVVWGSVPLWERRNYAVLRIFQGNESERPGVSQPDGDPTLSKWYIHPEHR